MKIAWSRNARADLRALHKFIARDSIFYADRMATRIIERVELAARHPAAGHAVHEYPERALREVHEDPYRIIYLHTSTEFSVVTLVHFKQQLGFKLDRAG